MTMLAEIADAVVGVDTHLDTHALLIAHPSGVPIASLTIANDPAGFAEAFGWLAEHAPGPRVYFAMEGTRSYGAGFTRALTSVGFPVIEVLRPARSTRRGRGKTDQIDADLAVLAALRMDVAKLPTPRADDRGKRCGFCWVRGWRSRQPAPGKSTGCGRCWSRVRTATDRWRAVR